MICCFCFIRQSLCSFSNVAYMYVSFFIFYVYKRSFHKCICDIHVQVLVKINTRDIIFIEFGYCACLVCNLYMTLDLSRLTAEPLSQECQDLFNSF